MYNFHFSNLFGNMVFKKCNSCDFFVTGNFQDKYSYISEVRFLRLYFINAMTMLTGVGGLYISLKGNEWTSINYIIIPWVVFMGYEQIALITSRRAEEISSFIYRLYTEMIILQDISLHLITNYSTMKIRVKLSIEPYEITCYLNYFLCLPQIGRTKKKKEMIESTLISMKRFLSDEFAVYEEKEEMRFKKELNENINT